MASEQLFSLADPRHFDRVRRRTRARVNDRIDRKMQACLAEPSASDRDGILARIHALDREWNVDRALMAHFAVLGGYAFLQSRRRKADAGWTGLFGSQLAFLMMHAVLGWCPPLPVFRALGFRTDKEIAAERLQLIRRLDELPGPIPDREAERLREE